ncbi:MAG: hypothetical protein Terrestrivirus5_52 [Terrestrivirus sp.]|uniref:Uncharacterized protein n=1 Tax=Terrestrivirus sp. TaxID=2487775 RepID=A0A3G4ZMZ0_9VIRU|nr:MAG: hypothetical protein Terrestrivirus5_52 [Terrestrivirus sp.]
MDSNFEESSDSDDVILDKIQDTNTEPIITDPDEQPVMVNYIDPDDIEKHRDELLMQMETLSKKYDIISEKYIELTNQFDSQCIIVEKFQRLIEESSEESKKQKNDTKLHIKELETKHEQIGQIESKLNLCAKEVLENKHKVSKYEKLIVEMQHEYSFIQDENVALKEQRRIDGEQLKMEQAQKNRDYNQFQESYNKMQITLKQYQDTMKNMDKQKEEVIKRNTELTKENSSLQARISVLEYKPQYSTQYPTQYSQYQTQPIQTQPQPIQSIQPIQPTSAQPVKTYQPYIDKGFW